MAIAISYQLTGFASFTLSAKVLIIDLGIKPPEIETEIAEFTVVEIPFEDVAQIGQVHEKNPYESDLAF
jgi:hypothetical protein